MSNAVRFHISNKISSASFLRSSSSPFHHRYPYHIRLPVKSRHRASLSLHSLHHLTPPPPPVEAEAEPSTSSDYNYYISSVGSPLHFKFTQRHITLLSVTACITAVSATCLFLSAIPTLLAFKRAAESLEKLMDVTREELPHTMAAIRLSGMEISDLTMELSDLGQEITQGVKSSTKAVRIAEERLRGFTNMTSPPPASLQRVPSGRTNSAEPVVAKTARGLKEGIVKGRAFLQMLFTLTQFSRVALNYFKKRAKK